MKPIAKSISDHPRARLDGYMTTKKMMELTKGVLDWSEVEVEQ